MARLLLVFVLSIGGCASDPVLVSEPITVTEEEISNYWIYDSTVSFRGSRCIDKHMEDHMEGHAVVDMVIDSNGVPHVLDILEMIPDCVLSKWPKEYAEASRYVPAPGNENRIPIRTRKTVKAGGWIG